MGDCMAKVLFFSGAGLSADSGLGVFRGSNGLWDKYDIKKVCTYDTWLDNYDLVHEFYNLRRVEYAKATPNPMHKTIAQLQLKYGSDKVIVITQNVDDLLERAGCTDVLHVHGRINYIYCVSCGKEIKITGAFEGGQCDKCSGKIFKPSIVFFGEIAPEYTPMYQLITGLSNNDMIAVIGTEGSVVPIGQIIGNKTHGIKAKRLLCNLEQSYYINDNNFDYVYYTEAKNAVDKIRFHAEQVLNG